MCWSYLLGKSFIRFNYGDFVFFFSFLLWAFWRVFYLCLRSLFEDLSPIPSLFPHGLESLVLSTRMLVRNIRYTQNTLTQVHSENSVMERQVWRKPAKLLGLWLHLSNRKTLLILGLREGREWGVLLESNERWNHGQPHVPDIQGENK